MWCTSWAGVSLPRSLHFSHRGCAAKKIDGCANLKNEPFVEDVLVIWCATRLQGDVTVVGWYKRELKLKNYLFGYLSSQFSPQ